VVSLGSLARSVAGLSDRWYWTEDAFPPVAFCVRALILDGLSVPPFDRHPDGDGRLRDLGLDAKMWQAWLSAVVAQHAIMGEYARTATAAHAGPPAEWVRAAAVVLRAPGSFCPGPDALQARLNELFTAEAAEWEAWRWRMSDVRHLHGTGRHQRALWRALAPFQDQLAPLSILLVEYPEPVALPLPPNTAIIAPGASPDAFGRQLVQVATGLATPA